MNTIKSEILAQFTDNVELSNADLAERLYRPEPSIRRETANLVAEGKLTKQKHGSFYRFALVAAALTWPTTPDAIDAIKEGDRFEKNGVTYVAVQGNPDGAGIDGKTHGFIVKRSNATWGVKAKLQTVSIPSGTSSCLYLVPEE